MAVPAGLQLTTETEAVPLTDIEMLLPDSVSVQVPTSKVALVPITVIEQVCPASAVAVASLTAKATLQSSSLLEKERSMCPESTLVMETLFPVSMMAFSVSPVQLGAICPLSKVQLPTKAEVASPAALPRAPALPPPLPP